MSEQHRNGDGLGAQAPNRPLVYIIEDDDDARVAIVAMLGERGYRCREFPSAEAFLAASDINSQGCLVLDYQLPGISGLELQHQLQENGVCLPIVVTTGKVDVPAAVRFMQQGAVTILEKPFRAKEISRAIDHAVKKGAVQAGVRSRFDQINTSVEQLSSREKTVLQAIVAGQLNKAIARGLDVSVRTVEGDRAKIVDKFGAETTGEVVGKFAQYSLLSELGFGENGATPDVTSHV